MGKRSELSDDLKKLEKIGFEVQSPQDEFTYQPDSGSTTGGAIGKDEYGIEEDTDEGVASFGEKLSIRNLDDESADSDQPDGSATMDSVDPDFPGISEYSLDQVTAMKDLLLLDVKDPNKSRQKALALVKKRLTDAPELQGDKFDVSIENNVLILQGQVASLAHKQTAREIAEAIVGSGRVDERLGVIR